MTWPQTMRMTSADHHAFEEFEAVEYGRGLAWKRKCADNFETSHRYIELHGFRPEHLGETLAVSTIVKVVLRR